jgi:hypothetical protein
MKNAVLSIPLLFTLFSCQSEGYTPDRCLEKGEPGRTKNLLVSEPMPDFTAVTDGGKTVTLSAMNRNAVLIFFKQAVPKGETRILFNEEIVHAGIGELAKERQCDVMITNEAILSGIYGVELNDDASVKQSVLVVADKDKAIQNIYRGSCEDHIIEILKGM